MNELFKKRTAHQHSAPLKSSIHLNDRRRDLTLARTGWQWPGQGVGGCGFLEEHFKVPAPVHNRKRRPNDHVSLDIY